MHVATRMCCELVPQEEERTWNICSKWLSTPLQMFTPKPKTRRNIRGVSFWGTRLYGMCELTREYQGCLMPDDREAARKDSFHNHKAGTHAIPNQSTAKQDLRNERNQHKPGGTVALQHNSERSVKVKLVLAYGHKGVSVFGAGTPVLVGLLGTPGKPQFKWPYV